jgi:acyl-CoA reductase-like NAD-dependent aldehyde dehydrogenase
VENATLLRIAEEIEERAETIGMMQLSETGFEEWNGPGEDIYDACARLELSLSN